MATVIKTKNGKKIVLLTPAERSKRYARELSNNRKQDGTRLTDFERGLRAGVLNERSLQAKIYNKQNDLKSKSKSKSKSRSKRK